MKLKTKIILSLVFILVLPGLAKAEDISSTTALTAVPIINNASTSSIDSLASTTQGTVLGVQAPDIPPLLTQIKTAKQLLSEVKLNYALSPVYKTIKNKKTGKSTKTLTGYNLWAKDIALAVLDPATQKISIVRGMQEGKKMTFKDPAVQVKLTFFNGVNSKFSVSEPGGGTVLALKYLITGTESGSKAAIVSDMHEAVYVPSSPLLASTDVLKYGETYLNGIIRQATTELQSIPSQSFPGKMLTEAIKPALIKALVYAEHTDTGAILNGSDESVRNTINNLNILLATNEGDSYKYSVSSAGARGIAQFMPSTYTGLVKRHPEAGLISDVKIGLEDHKNSIKAMYLLLDDYAGAVRVKAASGFSEGQIFDYGAASYNGGVTRVAKAVNTFGVYWNEDASEKLAAVKAQVSSLSSQVKTLTAQIKKAKDKTAKSKLQLELADSKTRLASAQNQLNNLNDATLRNETVNYLKKIYKVIHIFNDQTI